MQVIDELGDVGHVDFVGVAVEGVERESSDQAVAERAHLFEKVALLISVPSGCQLPHSSITSLMLCVESNSPSAAHWSLIKASMRFAL